MSTKLAIQVRPGDLFVNNLTKLAWMEAPTKHLSQVKQDTSMIFDLSLTSISLGKVRNMYVSHALFFRVAWRTLKSSKVYSFIPIRAFSKHRKLLRIFKSYLSCWCLTGSFRVQKFRVIFIPHLGCRRKFRRSEYFRFQKRQWQVLGEFTKIQWKKHSTELTQKW